MTKIIEGVEYISEDIPGKGICLVPKKLDLWEELLKDCQSTGISNGLGKFIITYNSDLEYKFSVSDIDLFVTLYRTWKSYPNMIEVHHPGILNESMSINRMVDILRKSGMVKIERRIK